MFVISHRLFLKTLKTMIFNLKLYSDTEVGSAVKFFTGAEHHNICSKFYYDSFKVQRTET